MKNVKILETGEMQELRVYDVNGTDWTIDCFGNGGVHADGDGIYNLSQDDFEWWDSYIRGENATVADVERIASEKYISPFALIQELRSYVGDNCNDMDYERAVAQEFLKNYE